MTDRALRRLALACFGAGVVLTVALVVLASGIRGDDPRLAHGGFVLHPGAFLVMTALAVTALLLVWARPRNAVGWVLTAASLLGTTCEFGQVYGQRALTDDTAGLPAGALVLSWSAGLWIPSLFLPASVLLLRYPTGRLSGPWARRVERALVVAFGVMWVGYSGSVESVSDEVLGVDPPVLLPRAVAMGLLVPAMLVIAVGTLVSVGMTVRRLLRASYPERPQLALLATAATVSVVVVFFSPYELMGQVAYALLPVAVAVGVLRYRLLGIEVVVRRTLLYGALTAAVLLVFVVVTTSMASVVPTGGAPEVVAASLVAVGVVPLRDRLQRGVDRLLYGDRADPWAALGRLGREAAGDDALAAVVAAVAEGLRLPGAEVRGADGTAAAHGEVGDDALEVPLVVAEEQVGLLRVSPRRGERSLGPADDRLLRALAPLVALVLRSSVLAEALRVEQARVVEATEAERARLRRDLHDGLGPSLTGIGLGLEAVDGGGLPDRSSAIVRRLREEVGASLEEVRRIIDGLRPGALETGDLLASVRARAAHLTATSPLRVDVDAPPSLPRLPAEVETAALRVVEEALTNVVRHARATTCRVVVAVDPDLRVEVRDDGVGYAGPRDGGVGMASMHARAAALGGCVEVTRTDPGTVVRLALPIGVPA